MLRKWIKNMEMTEEDWEDPVNRWIFFIGSTVGIVFSILMWVFTAPQGRKPPGSW